MLTGNKDVDRMIFNKLEDVDLVKACQVNKQAESLCNDQVFWMNRVFNKYNYVGGDVLRKYKGTRSWSEYYIQDLRKIQSNVNKYLMEGSKNGRLDQVIIALKKGVSANIHDDALRYASETGHLDVVKYLVGLGANIQAGDYGALRNASYYGHLDVVKYLVGFVGANINSQNDEALRFASMNGRLDVVKYLIGEGADIHANNDEVLRLAIRCGHLDVVTYLVGEVLISMLWMIYSSSNGQLGVVKYLVGAGADIHARNYLALRYASEKGQLGVVKYIESL